MYSSLYLRFAPKKNWRNLYQIIERSWTTRGKLSYGYFILIDFERAALNHVCQVDPNTELKRFFYHFPSNIWKHIQNRYQDDENFAL